MTTLVHKKLAAIDSSQARSQVWGSVGEYFSLTSDNSIFDNSHSSAALNLKLEPGQLTQDFLTTAPEKSEKLSSDSSLPQ